MRYELMNEWVSYEFHMFLEIYVSNVFSMHDISVWNIWITNEQIFGQVVRC
jgi:hypothetical protein